MKNIFKIILVPFLAVMMSPVFADDHMQSTDFFPVEFYHGCEFSRGKDVTDLEDPIADWNEFEDESGNDSYSAWVLTPIFHSNVDFNGETAIWMGAWNSWSDMGSELNNYFANGTSAAEGFNKVWNCANHSLTALSVVRSNPNSNTDGGVLSFQSCTVNDGKSLADLVEADAKWNNFADSAGMSGGTYRMFPTAGIMEEDDDVDFWQMNAVSSLEAWGANAQKYVDNSGGLVQASIYGDIVSCEDQEIYQASNKRSASAN